MPYTLQEESQILAACDQIGGGKYNRSGASYERLRARAMVMLLRHTALRVSDVCTLRKDAISWDQEKTTWRVLLRTQKSGEPVYLPIPESLKLVLDALPLPRNAAQDCPYYFWNGQTSRRAVVGIAERTLAAVFKKSGVKNAHAHRYRHTLATRLLEQGATSSRSPTSWGTARRSFGSTTASGRRAGRTNIDRLMMAHFQTGGRYNSSHKTVTRKNGGRKLMTPKEIFWCGEGDLNPHEIAPASTSSYSSDSIPPRYNRLRATEECDRA